MRHHYALEQDPIQPEGVLVGWLYRFPTQAKRDQFVTETKWRSKAITSNDLVVRHAKGAGKWFGWPVRIHTSTRAPLAISPYEASLTRRSA